MAGRRHAHHSNRRQVQQLPLDTARQCFTWLVTGPDPLSVDGRKFSGLPNRLVPLNELRSRMLRCRCSRRTRDAVWAHLVRRSREEGATWTLACTGMALPALASTSRWLAARYPGDAFDVQAEVLSGFLSALADIDLDRPRVLVRLRWAAYRAGHAALAEALGAPTPVASGFHSSPPRPPWGHPDLVLAQAVRQSVLTRTEADLIGATRLEESAITGWAVANRTTTDAAYKARQRAERRLVAFLRDQALDTDSNDPVAASVLADPDRPARQLRTGSSHSVSNSPDDAAQKAPDPLSNSRPETGLLRCGGSSPAASPRQSSEVPRCA
ncbi:hypothetical protein [Streptomyces rapamycinicus]|uniref:Uncharacterized protein n=2 Tax=Streptomyces rapamycinicus TaxID=1226757 RepID=A0A0A0NN28_STRRN|nr:hypothetical protein [Streptomyces rapamycinicus]AGP58359.1 hypothetical protein M271_34740 [Streptomyces rapamycinicus NRRL 5491]MBB4786053.1 hypothetical protein [Streptomyces rapamycinicus]RLV78484.1 hypothetical protein D3C57_108905 [Streptomyces rapamycinicus NRRL 5491]UTO66175.1 hypothetical protein LJB45_30200 [Streptomyces rapamycinicus]UTP34129.1 hypothetical protein LIV37_35335 [Streptomyces rapamycinicus NRRL 5491]